MKRFLLYFAILLSLTLTVSCAKKAPTLDTKECKKAEGYFHLGVSYMYNDDPTSALGELLKGEKLCAHDPRIQNALGLVYYAKERFDKSILHLEKALELDPEDADASHNLGVVYLYLNRYDEAIKCFKKALENDLYRNQANSMNAVGWAYYKQNDYANAEKYFKETLNHDRMYLTAYDNLAKVYIALNRFDDAIIELLKALDLNSYYPEALLDIGICYLKMGDKDKAKIEFKKVTQIDPMGKLGSQAQEFLNLLE